MSFKATSLVILALCSILAPVNSAPTFWTRQDSNSTLPNTNTTTTADQNSTVKEAALTAQKLNAGFETANDTTAACNSTPMLFVY